MTYCAVHQADAHAGDGLLERDLRERQRRRGAGDGEHVGVVVGVGREHQRDDLRFVAPAGGEQRTDRPVDQAAGEDFLLGRLAFALEEAAGDAARGVGVFAVVDRERQEVDAFARARRVARRDEHHRVAQADDDGAVGLLGQLAGLDRQGRPPSGMSRLCIEPSAGSRSRSESVRVACRVRSEPRLVALRPARPRRRPA